MANRTPRGADLREACIQEALTIVETVGLEGLSLREIARRLGVSHQAPYKHFSSRDHVLAEIVRRAYDSFAAYLTDRPAAADPFTDLAAIGDAYLRYAHQHPLQYRLMFGTPLPNPEQHPAMMQSAQEAFNCLHRAIAHIKASASGVTPAEVDLDTLYIWAAMHGLATVLQSPALHTLTLQPGVLDRVEDHVRRRLEAALAVADSQDHHSQPS